MAPRPPPGATAAAGGGDWMYPARDRYEPGQTVTMIGYGIVLADAPTDAYHGYLRRADSGEGGTPPGGDLGRPGRRLGPVTIQHVEPHWGHNVRVSIEFPLPDDLAPGTYEVDLCTNGCELGLGWFLPSPVHVGTDPPEPVVRDWPLSDPAICWLEDGALLGISGGTVTAADVRAGRAVDPPPGQQVPLPEVTLAPATSAPRPPHAGGAGSTSSGAAGGPTGRSGAGAPPADARAGADVVATDRPHASGAVGFWLPAAGAAVLTAAVAGPWLAAARGRRTRTGAHEPTASPTHDGTSTPSGGNPAAVDATRSPDDDAVVRL